jgi:tetratricopeptide (TPR) repeat protein
LNFQSIDGASAAARSIVEQRTRQNRPVRVFPVPMRVEVSAEKIKYEHVSSYALNQFLATEAEQAVLAGTPPRSYWDSVAVPYIGFYVFEEVLAWFLDLNRTTGVLAATLRLAKHVVGVDALSLPAPAVQERQEVLAQYAAVWAERIRDQQQSVDYDRICFVVMPLGKKLIDAREVDFDAIYESIFRPAISAVRLPDGGTLEPRRPDREFFSGDMNLEMLRYLEYARLVIVDISGLNPNVAYQLSLRYRARQVGTAIFRQAQLPVSFDISAIRVLPYETAPIEGAERARSLITRMLAEALATGKLDSPVRLAVGQQRQSRKLEPAILGAENAIRNQDWAAAIKFLQEVISDDPNNPVPRMKLGLLCRDRGLWRDAFEQFSIAAETSPRYGEAHREKGIAENKLAQQERGPLEQKPAPGEAALRRAIELNDKDFDAHTALGGVLMRAGRYSEALQYFERAVELSGGNPYALLSALKLRVQVKGRLQLTRSDRSALKFAEQVREAQTKQKPPYEAPWSFFDLAEIKLLAGDVSGFVETAMSAASYSEQWHIDTFLQQIHMLEPAASEIPGLGAAIAELEGRLRDAGFGRSDPGELKTARVELGQKQREVDRLASATRAARRRSVVLSMATVASLAIAVFAFYELNTASQIPTPPPVPRKTTFNVCFGEGGGNNCLAGADAKFGCGSYSNWSEKRWDELGAGLCEGSKFTKVQIQNNAGGGCGWTAYRLTCEP